MDNSGYIGVEIEQFLIASSENKTDSIYRLELELVGRSDILWSSNNSSKLTTSDYRGQEIEIENTLSIACNLYQRTIFIDMSDIAVNSIINSYFILRIILIGPKLDEAAIAAAAKGKKGAAAVPESSDITLAEICFPLSSLIKEKSGKINFQSSFQNLQLTLPRTSFHNTINSEKSSLSINLSLDNGFLEYIALGNIIQVEYSSLQNVPYDWCLPITIPVEKGKGGGAAAKGKGKEPPPTDELRTKELQYITDTLNNQSNLAQYTLTISSQESHVDQEQEQKEQAEEEENKTRETTQNWIPFPTITLSDGRLDFNKESSSNYNVTEEEPLRSHADLWSLSWGPSSYIFFHRSILKKLTSQLETGNYPSLQVIIKRLPSSIPQEPTTTKSKEPQPEPIKELTATAQLNITPIIQPDIKGLTLTCLPTGDGLESSHISGSIMMIFSNPFVITTSFPSSDILPVDAISLKQVNGGVLNRDVKKELRNEISLIVKEIAQEYVSLYPQPPSTGGGGGGGGGGNNPNDSDALEQRKGHFLYHLSSTGIYHRLKEVLKPKIQRVVRERYGARNRALGKVEKTIPSTGFDNQEKLPMEEMLSELFIVLVKECNTVLNAMYKSTIVSRDTEELEKCATIDDETETPQQKFYRLFCLCNDSEGDQRYSQAEQYHLERIQLLEYEITLNTDPQAPHHAYYQYYEYLIRRSAEELLEYRITQYDLVSHSLVSPTEDIPENVELLREKGKECLQQAILLKNNHWMSYLQLGCLLLEMNQIEKASDALQTALTLQLDLDSTSGGTSTNNNSINNDIINQLQGYESDKLCPGSSVHPLTYIMLALYYSKVNQTLNTRKSIRLAVKCYQQGDYDPPVTSHGKPHRTAVLLLCQGALFLYEHGFTHLGNLCTQYSQDCEQAVIKKAEERNLSACTIPFIRHLLKKTQCYSYLYHGDLQSAYKYANDCYGVSVSSSDIIQSNLCITKVCSYFNKRSHNNEGEVEEYLEASILAYFRALKEAQHHNLFNLIPLVDYINLGKILITKGRYQDALESMLHGCRLYPSSSLFNLIGICCLRLDKMIDAEDSLQEANLIDNRNASVWAYLCILCLSTGGHRLEEADNCCYQALRLGLTNSNILREMVTSYIAVDKLYLAEELIRRVIASEEREYSKCSSYTRRLLGDILAGQNQAAQAIEEYQLVIEDNETELDIRIEASNKCLKLLESLGRREECVALESILRSLQEGEE